MELQVRSPADDTGVSQRASLPQRGPVPDERISPDVAPGVHDCPRADRRPVLDRGLALDRLRPEGRRPCCPWRLADDGEVLDRDSAPDLDVRQNDDVVAET